MSLVFQPVGMLFFYKLQQSIHKYNTRVSVTGNQSQRTKILLSIREFQDHKVNDHEINISGEWYDIKQCNTVGSQVELLVVRDHDEEAIIKRILNATNCTLPPDRDLSKIISLLLSFNYVSTATPNWLSLNCVSTPQHAFICRNTTGGFIEIIAPPPRMIL